MRVFTLKRIVHNSDGNYGIWITDKGLPRWVSYELPWKNNQKDISCIRAGEYIFSLYPSPKRGYMVYKTEEAQGREAIEIHIGNGMPDTNGCLLPGMSFGIFLKENLGEFYGVVDSAKAFKQFMSELNGDSQFKLVILDC